MQRSLGLLIALGTLAIAGCASDDREWMKVNQKYTTQEFARDHKACTRDGKPNEACMRERGWVPVTPSKADSEPPKDAIPRSKSRY